LQWITSNDEPGDVFDIERSIDGRNFINAGTVSANVFLNNHYSFSDTVSAANIYYRLKINNISGNSFYSNIILFRNGIDYTNEIRLLQNPVASRINLECTFKQAGKLVIRLTDVSGRVMMVQPVDINTGITELNLGLPVNCSNSIYFLHAESVGIKKNFCLLIRH
jgi:hypothetical protein